MFAKAGMVKLSRKAEGKVESIEARRQDRRQEKQEKRWGSLNTPKEGHMPSFYDRMQPTPVSLWLPRLSLNTGQSRSYFTE